MCLKCVIKLVKPNKTELFEDSFFWGGVNLNAPFIFQEEVI